MDAVRTRKETDVRDKPKDLLIIEAALANPETLTDEQRELLEWNQGLLSSNLLYETQAAFARGDDEVAMVLAKALCEKYDPDRFRPRDECVIYCRVSSEQQTAGHGLTRQLEVCQKYASENRLHVVAVFSEVASGAGDLPIRAAAERVAKRRTCAIICEDYDRWSRKGVEDMPPKHVIMASDSLKMMEEELRKVLTPFEYKIVTGKPM